MNKPKHSQPNPLRSERGTALSVVFFITFFTTLVLAAYLARALTQKRVNLSSTSLYEARNAAEGVTEFAVAEIARRAKSYSSVSVTPLSGYTLPPAEKTMLSPEDASHVSTDPLAHVIQSSLDFKCSDLSPRPTTPLLLDDNDPVYKDDLSKGKSVSVRSCNVYGKATTLSKSGKQISAYVWEHIQIREESWLNYAVFYNMDMEFHAGPNLTITGPVHTNADAYVAEGSGAALMFLSTFTTHGKIYRAIKYDLTNPTFTGSCSFQSAAGASTSTVVAMDTSHDSRMSGFASYASNTWHSYVLDAAPPFSPDGMPTYTPEDFSTPAIELRNNAALIIEPQLSTEAPTVLHTSVADRAAGNYYPNGRAGQKSVVDENSAENIKFSALAGMIIKVEDLASAIDNPRWKLLIPVPTTAGLPISKQNLPRRNADGTPQYVVYDPFALTDDVTDPGVVANQLIRRQLKRELLDAIQFIRYREGASAYGNGTADLYVESLPLPHAGNTGTDAASPATNFYAIYDRRQGNTYLSSATNGLMGAYHVLRIDLAKLNTLINDNTGGLWQIPATGANSSPSVCWTGVIYVEMPLAAYDATRFVVGGDQIRPAQAATLTTPGYAVVLANGSILPRLPSNPSVRSDGFTVATNGPLYIQGHYNADGNLGTGSSSTPDVYANPATSTSELPALIAADSVTVLSAAWNTNAFMKSNQQKPNASDTEISTAIITGLVPTHPGLQNIWSAGVHNLVRYQENWGSATYRYRGSLAAIFESEVSKQPYHEDDHGWYDPPTRDMGYHQYLSQGWFPPGAPIKRTVRRMDLRDINQATYTTGPSVPAAAN